LEIAAKFFLRGKNRSPNFPPINEGWDQVRFFSNKLMEEETDRFAPSAHRGRSPARRIPDHPDLAHRPFISPAKSSRSTGSFFIPSGSRHHGGGGCILLQKTGAAAEAAIWSFPKQPPTAEADMPGFEKLPLPRRRPSGASANGFLPGRRALFASKNRRYRGRRHFLLQKTAATGHCPFLLSHLGNSTKIEGRDHEQ
jgi:hypothetical protein